MPLDNDNVPLRKSTQADNIPAYQLPCRRYSLPSSLFSFAFRRRPSDPGRDDEETMQMLLRKEMCHTDSGDTLDVTLGGLPKDGHHREIERPSSGTAVGTVAASIFGSRRRAQSEGQTSWKAWCSISFGTSMTPKKSKIIGWVELKGEDEPVDYAHDGLEEDQAEA